VVSRSDHYQVLLVHSQHIPAGLLQLHAKSTRKSQQEMRGQERLMKITGLQEDLTRGPDAARC